MSESAMAGWGLRLSQQFDNSTVPAVGQVSRIMSLAMPLRRSRAARSCAARLRHAVAALTDRALNVSTIYAPSESKHFTRFQDAVDYEAIDYLLISSFFRRLTITPKDVVFDVGCGMGRVVCAMARRRLRKIVGIEFNPALARCATRNARLLRGRISQIEIRQQDAAFADYREGTVFWLFNPFGSRTLEAFIRRVEASLRLSPRLVQIAYVNPVHEIVLESISWLRCTDRVDANLYCRFGASYWTNAAPGAIERIS